MLRISADKMRETFSTVLQQAGFSIEKAEACATIFTENSCDGVYTHGLNRFPVFVNMVRQGLVDSQAEPMLISTNGLIEQWDGKLAPGMLNGKHCMARAISLAEQSGIGCVTIRNTSHWMRGGTYGWQAADRGHIGICFTNTIANMPPWGGTAPRLGNNPLVIAVPRQQGHIVLDMAMSQFSFGKLLQYQSEGNTLPHAGGYDEHGKLSTNPGAIVESQRLLPVGFWKGSGLSLMLDLLATILSGGRSTAEITAAGEEYGISQVFISIKPGDPNHCESLTEQIITYTKSSTPENPEKPVSYPGEHTLKTRLENQKTGIPVDEKIWNEVLEMLH